MTFEQWYEEAYRKGQDWPFDYKKSMVYLAMKEAYNAGKMSQHQTDKSQ